MHSQFPINKYTPVIYRDENSNQEWIPALFSHVEHDERTNKIEVFFYLGEPFPESGYSFEFDKLKGNEVYVSTKQPINNPITEDAIFDWMYSNATSLGSFK